MKSISRWRGKLSPKFLRGPQAVDMTVVGTNLAPSSHPLHLLSVTPSGNLTYERLFADMSADNSPTGYYYPGTFGLLVPAGKGRTPRT